MQCPDLLVQLGVFISKELPIERIIDQKCHKGRRSFFIFRIRKLLIYFIDLELDILQILVLESPILEYEALTRLLQDDLVQAFQIVVIELTAEDVLVYLLDELHQLLQLPGISSVLLWVSLSHQEHLSIVLPKSDEVCVFLDDQINDEQSGQYFSKIVKYLKVYHFLEAVLVHLILSLVEAVHLIDNILGQVNDSPDDVEELVEHLQRSTDLELVVSGLFFVITHIFEYKTTFSK